MRTSRKPDPRIDRLSAVSLFQGCPRRELDVVARLTCPVTLRAGTVLCRQGHGGREAFVLVDGEAVVDIDGVETARLGPGSLCGEMALLDGGLRCATVTAVTPIEAYALSAAEFCQLMSEAPTVMRRVAAELSKRLRQAEAAPAG